jgi:ferric-dicitrate binding protein FerR (iron transport regulator)
MPAPEPGRPLDPEHVWRAGRRRRQRRLFTLGLAIVAVAGLAAAAVAWLDWPEPNQTIAAGRRIVVEDPTHSFTVEYPRPGTAPQPLRPL